MSTSSGRCASKARSSMKSHASTRTLHTPSWVSPPMLPTRRSSELTALWPCSVTPTRVVTRRTSRSSTTLMKRSWSSGVPCRTKSGRRVLLQTRRRRRTMRARAPQPRLRPKRKVPLHLRAKLVRHQSRGARVEKTVRTLRQTRRPPLQNVAASHRRSRPQRRAPVPRSWRRRPRQPRRPRATQRRLRNLPIRLRMPRRPRGKAARRAATTPSPSPSRTRPLCSRSPWSRLSESWVTQRWTSPLSAVSLRNGTRTQRVAQSAPLLP
mmetsp:Transcript_38229/g.88707  ORF Transcript_38229/g.88707 Transcript_38229/m.88707 type:complete len:266 (+) Transcript_38229:445-1242(+)